MYTVEIAERFPDRVAAVMASTGEQWTFSEFEAEANRVAHLLRGMGLEEGDRVAIVMRNCLQMLAIQAAAERVGLYHVPVNWHLTPRESSYIINDSKARVVFTQAVLMESAAELPALCEAVEHWVMVEAPDGADPYVDYDALVRDQPTDHVPNQRTGRPLPYSSGTTGQPKGILRALPGTDPAEPVPIVKSAQLAYRFREGMIMLEPAPMYHSAVHSHLSAALRMGGTSIIMDRFDAEGMLRLIAEHQVTHIMLVPTMMSRLLQLPEDVKSRYDLSSLEAAVHGAAPCPPPVKMATIEWLGPIVWENFGSSEANGGCIVSSEEWIERPGTVGKPLFGEPVILDEDDNEVPVGTVGQIWWRGAAEFEYLNDEEKTSDAKKEAGGPLSTSGDIGYIDEDGYLYLTDRASFTIIRGGVNVYPQEVENVLVEHPAVADVAVFGIPHAELGEVVQAMVELRPGHPSGPELEAELIEFCREHLAKFKCPEAVDFVDELPRLETGKVQKKVLRERYVEGATAGS
jgi:long-chain acyl-CoA synthetase